MKTKKLLIFALNFKFLLFFRLSYVQILSVDNSYLFSALRTAFPMYLVLRLFIEITDYFKTTTNY
jgi:hypothetical protein